MEIETLREVEAINKGVELALLKQALAEKDLEIQRLKHYQAKCESLKSLLLKFKEHQHSLYTLVEIIEGF